MRPHRRAVAGARGRRVMTARILRGDVVRLMQGDCLERMSEIANGSVDMVLTDPPYGTTACKWDSVILLGPMWEQLKRVTKKRSAIVLMAVQPFESVLIASNLGMFRYCWVWEKSRPTGHLNANRMPLKSTEDIVVFYNRQCIYNPQMTKGQVNHVREGSIRKSSPSINLYGHYENVERVKTTAKFPRQVLRFDVGDPAAQIHNTQKPVALMEYLIQTYTNTGDTVLDFTMGSGTTGVACKNLGREFVGIELDATYFEVAKRRIEQAQPPLTGFNEAVQDADKHAQAPLFAPEELR